MPRIDGTYQTPLMVFALTSPEPRDLAKWLARLYLANVLDDPWPVLVAQLRGYGAGVIELPQPQPSVRARWADGAHVRVTWDGGVTSYAPVPNGGQWVSRDAEGLRSLVEHWMEHPPFRRSTVEPPLTEQEQRLQAFMNAQLTRGTDTP